MGKPVKMTLPTLRVLKLMLDDPTGQHYGLELARAARLASGSIYPILARLEKAEWLTSGWEDIDPVRAGRPPRRYYMFTGLGRALAWEALADYQLHQPASGWASPGLPSPGAAPS